VAPKFSTPLALLVSEVLGDHLPTFDSAVAIDRAQSLMHSLLLLLVLAFAEYFGFGQSVLSVFFEAPPLRFLLAPDLVFPDRNLL